MIRKASRARNGSKIRARHRPPPLLIMCAKSSSRCRAAWVYEQAFGCAPQHQSRALRRRAQSAAISIDTEAVRAKQPGPRRRCGSILRRRYYGAAVRLERANLPRRRIAARQRGLELRHAHGKVPPAMEISSAIHSARKANCGATKPTISESRPQMQAGWQFASATAGSMAACATAACIPNRADHYITAANPDDSGQTDYRKWLPSATLFVAGHRAPVGLHLLCARL